MDLSDFSRKFCEIKDNGIGKNGGKGHPYFWEKFFVHLKTGHVKSHRFCPSKPTVLTTCNFLYLIFFFYF